MAHYTFKERKDGELQIWFNVLYELELGLGTTQGTIMDNPRTIFPGPGDEAPCSDNLKMRSNFLTDSTNLTKYASVMWWKLDFELHNCYNTTSSSSASEREHGWESKPKLILFPAHADLHV